MVSSILRSARLALVAGALILVTGLTGCRSMVEAMGYTVVDDELVSISATRDKFTAKYVDATLPLVEEHLDGDAKLELKDMGETLKRVSAKEHKLIAGEIEEEED
jgi:hypothetical protein